MSITPEHLIIGLGNPGREYEATWHNLGFLAADLLAGENRLAFSKRTKYALIAEGAVFDHPCVIAKPRTYMNLSGLAAQALCTSYRRVPQKLLVICDDFSIPLGRLRLRREGSDGGHRGLQSIIEKLGTKAFPRLRLGMGPVPEGLDPADYVLSAIRGAGREIARDMAGKAVEGIRLLLEEGFDRAQNWLNT